MDQILAPRNLAELLVDTLRRLRVAHERIQSLEADVEVYRMGWQQAINALHELTKDRDRLRRSNQQLHEDRRAYTKANGSPTVSRERAA